MNASQGSQQTQQGPRVSQPPRTPATRSSANANWRSGTARSARGDWDRRLANIYAKVERENPLGLSRQELHKNLVQKRMADMAVKSPHLFRQRSVTPATPAPAAQLAPSTAPPNVQQQKEFPFSGISKLEFEKPEPVQKDMAPSITGMPAATPIVKSAPKEPVQTPARNPRNIFSASTTRKPNPFQRSSAGQSAFRRSTSTRLDSRSSSRPNLSASAAAGPPGQLFPNGSAAKSEKNPVFDHVLDSTNRALSYCRTLLEDNQRSKLEDEKKARIEATRLRLEEEERRRRDEYFEQERIRQEEEERIREETFHQERQRLENERREQEAKIKAEEARLQEQRDAFERERVRQEQETRRKRIEAEERARKQQELEADAHRRELERRAQALQREKAREEEEEEELRRQKEEAVQQGLAPREASPQAMEIDTARAQREDESSKAELSLEKGGAASQAQRPVDEDRRAVAEAQRDFQQELASDAAGLEKQAKERLQELLDQSEAKQPKPAITLTSSPSRGVNLEEQALRMKEYLSQASSRGVSPESDAGSDVSSKADSNAGYALGPTATNKREYERSASPIVADVPSSEPPRQYPSLQKVTFEGDRASIEANAVEADGDVSMEDAEDEQSGDTESEGYEDWDEEMEDVSGGSEESSGSDEPGSPGKHIEVSPQVLAKDVTAYAQLQKHQTRGDGKPPQAIKQEPMHETGVDESTDLATTVDIEDEEEPDSPTEVATSQELPSRFNDGLLPALKSGHDVLSDESEDEEPGISFVGRNVYNRHGRHIGVMDDEGWVIANSDRWFIGHINPKKGEFSALEHNPSARARRFTETERNGPQLSETESSYFHKSSRGKVIREEDGGSEEGSVETESEGSREEEEEEEEEEGDSTPEPTYTHKYDRRNTAPGNPNSERNEMGGGEQRAEEGEEGEEDEEDAEGEEGEEDEEEVREGQELQLKYAGKYGHGNIIPERRKPEEGDEGGEEDEGGEGAEESEGAEEAEESEEGGEDEHEEEEEGEAVQKWTDNEDHDPYVYEVIELSSDDTEDEGQDATSRKGPDVLVDGLEQYSTSDEESYYDSDDTGPPPVPSDSRNERWADGPDSTQIVSREWPDSASGDGGDVGAAHEKRPEEVKVEHDEIDGVEYPSSQGSGAKVIHEDPAIERMTATSDQIDILDERSDTSTAPEEANKKGATSIEITQVKVTANDALTRVDEETVQTTTSTPNWNAQQSETRTPFRQQLFGAIANVTPSFFKSPAWWRKPRTPTEPATGPSEPEPSESGRPTEAGAGTPGATADVEQIEGAGAAAADAEGEEPEYPKIQENEYYDTQTTEEVTEDITYPQLSIEGAQGQSPTSDEAEGTFSAQLSIPKAEAKESGAENGLELDNTTREVEEPETNGLKPAPSAQVETTETIVTSNQVVTETTVVAQDITETMEEAEAEYELPYPSSSPIERKAEPGKKLPRKRPRKGSVTSPRAGRDSSEPPQKRSRRLAGLRPDSDGLNQQPLARAGPVTRSRSRESSLAPPEPSVAARGRTKQPRSRSSSAEPAPPKRQTRRAKSRSVSAEPAPEPSPSKKRTRGDRSRSASLAPIPEVAQPATATKPRKRAAPPPAPREGNRSRSASLAPIAEASSPPATRGRKRKERVDEEEEPLRRSVRARKR